MPRYTKEEREYWSLVVGEQRKAAALLQAVRLGYLCQKCGKSFRRVDIHHPQVNGGRERKSSKNELTYLQTITERAIKGMRHKNLAHVVLGRYELVCRKCHKKFHRELKNAK